jgi:hypothetical protein
MLRGSENPVSEPGHISKCSIIGLTLTISNAPSAASDSRLRSAKNQVNERPALQPR